MKIIQVSLTLLCVFMLSPLTIWAEEDAFTLTGEIVFVSERDGVYRNLYTMNANGSNVQQLTNYVEEEDEDDSWVVSSPQWSADGTMVAYLSSNGYLTGIDLLRADGAGLGNLYYDDTQDGPIDYLSWSPNGYTLVFDLYGEPGFFGASSSRVESRYDQPVFDYSDNARDPTWSPDSMQIAFTIGAWDAGEIVIVGSDGTETNITNHAADDHDPAWSPDGTKIVFASNRNGHDQLFVMRTDGSNVQQLTNTVANDHEPIWSPDGQYIAFTRTYLNGNSEIFAMKANGSTQTRLTNNLGYDGQPDWKPAAQMTLQKLLLLSSNSGGTVAGITFRDEDILAYHPTIDSWSFYFDGSDVGITTDIDALGLAWDSTLVMSFDVPTTVPGLGLVDDSDLVRFVPTNLGPNTAGTFTGFVNGSTLELTTDTEDVDALYSLINNDLVFSTTGRANVSGVIAQDEDTIHYRDDSYYRYGYKSWHLAFDGSQLALTTASEDIGGIGRDGGHAYYSTVGAFAMPGLSGDGADIFELTRDPATGQLQPTMFWDGSQHGFTGKIIDAFEIVYLTNVPMSSAALMAEEPAEVGDEVDNDYTTPDELIIYLPLISD